MGIYDGFDISSATIANFYCIFVKLFVKFMMRWKVFLDKI